MPQTPWGLFISAWFPLPVTIYISGSEYACQALAIKEIAVMLTSKLLLITEAELGRMNKMYCRLGVLMAEKDPQFSQRQLAEETKLALSTINRLFRNDFSRVDVNTVEILCNYFGCDVGDLFIMKDAA